MYHANIMFVDIVDLVVSSLDLGNTTFFGHSTMVITFFYIVII